MKKITDFLSAVTPTLGLLYELAKKYHLKNTTFLVKLSGIMIDGAQTGLFPVETLDPLRNLEANVNDALVELSMERTPDDLKAALDLFIRQVVEFDEAIPQKTLNEEKCFMGLEVSLLLYKRKRLTYGRLAALFIDLEGEENLNIEFPESVLDVTPDDVSIVNTETDF